MTTTGGTSALASFAGDRDRVEAAPRLGGEGDHLRRLGRRGNAFTLVSSMAWMDMSGKTPWAVSEKRLSARRSALKATGACAVALRPMP